MQVHPSTPGLMPQNTTVKPTDDYDASGALYYTVSVIMVYGMSLVLLLLSYMRKRHDLHTIYDQQVAVYMKGLPKARLRADKQWAKKAMKQRLKEWEQLYIARKLDVDEVEGVCVPAPPSSGSETSLDKYYKRIDNRLRRMDRLPVPLSHPRSPLAETFRFPGSVMRLNLDLSKKGDDSPKVPVYVSSEKVWVWVGSKYIKELKMHGVNKEGNRVGFREEEDADGDAETVTMERVTAL